MSAFLTSWINHRLYPMVLSVTKSRSLHCGSFKQTSQLENVCRSLSGPLLSVVMPCVQPKNNQAASRTEKRAASRKNTSAKDAQTIQQWLVWTNTLYGGSYLPPPCPLDASVRRVPRPFPGGYGATWLSSCLGVGGVRDVPSEISMEQRIDQTAGTSLPV